MKRLLVMIMVVVTVGAMCISTAYASIDLSGMTKEELEGLQKQIEQRITYLASQDLEAAQETAPAPQPPQKKEWLETAQQVRYISQRNVNHETPENVQRIWFALLDESETQLKSPAIVEVRIVNDSEETVYNATHYVDPSNYGTWTNSWTNAQNVLCSIDIPDSDIKPGSSKTGQIHITVSYKNDEYYSGLYSVFGFEEYSEDVSSLPYDSPAEQCTLEILEYPEEVCYKSGTKVLSKTTIENIDYEFSDSYDKGKATLEIRITGKKTFDIDGAGNSDGCRIGMKLYLGDYVIESTTKQTSSIETGEGYKDEKVAFGNLEPGAYMLKITDVKW